MANYSSAEQVYPIGCAVNLYNKESGRFESVTHVDVIQSMQQTNPGYDFSYYYSLNARMLDRAMINQTWAQTMQELRTGEPPVIASVHEPKVFTFPDLKQIAFAELEWHVIGDQIGRTFGVTRQTDILHHMGYYQWFYLGGEDKPFGGPRHYLDATFQFMNRDWDNAYPIGLNVIPAPNCVGTIKLYQPYWLTLPAIAFSDHIADAGTFQLNPMQFVRDTMLADDRVPAGVRS